MSQSDYKSMTIPQLMSALAERNVSLPANKQRKQYYIDLYEIHILGSEGKDTQSLSTPIKSRKSIANTKKRRRGAKDSAQQDEEESESTQPSSIHEDEVEDESEEEPQKKKSKNIEEESRLPEESKKVQQTHRLTDYPPSVTNRTTAITFNNNQGYDSLARTSGVTVIQQPEPNRRKTTAGNFGNSTIGTNPVIPPRPSIGYISPLLQKVTVNQEPPKYKRPEQEEKQPSLSDTAEDIQQVPSPSKTDVSTRSLRPSQVEQRRSTVEYQSLPLNIIMFIVWALIIFAGYIVIFGTKDGQFPHGKPYCDTEVNGSPILRPPVGNDKCQPCPPHGYCIGGKLEDCEKYYIKRNAICVRDEKIDKLAIVLLEIAQNKLAHQRGSYECRPAVQTFAPSTEDSEAPSILYPTSKGLLVDQVREDLEKTFIGQTVDGITIDKDTFDPSFNSFVTMVRNASQNFELEVEKVPGDDADREMIYSTNPIIPLSCRLEKKFRENRLFIVGCVIFLVLILVGNFLKKKRDQDRLDLEDLIRIVLTRLREKKRLNVVMLKANLKEEYPDINVDKFWSKVGEAIGQDCRVVEMTNSTTHDLMWAWKDDDNETGQEQQ